MLWTRMEKSYAAANTNSVDIQPTKFGIRLGGGANIKLDKTTD